MYNILYCGEIEYGYWLEEYCRYKGDTSVFTGYISSVDKLKYAAVSDTDVYDVIVIDIQNFIEDAEIVAGGIEDIQAAKPLKKIIIYAGGFAPNSNLILALKDHGINNILLKQMNGDVKKDFEKMLLNEGGIEDIQEHTVQEVSMTLPPVSTPKKNKVTTVAVCGAGSRIGATTQALQIIKSVQYKGNKACYVEINGTGYVRKIIELYDVVGENNAEYERKGLIQFQGVDIYYKPEKINEIHKSGYDYIVFDYGAMTSSDFNYYSFLEKDINIICCGISPSEFDDTYSAIDRTFENRAIKFIYSFVGKAEQKDVLKLMDNRAGNTFFAEYTPGAFEFDARNIELYDKLVYAQQKQKKRFTDFLRR